MARKSRIKFPNGINHIIGRSMSEINLFNNNDDKDYFLKILDKYQKMYLFSIYAFILMDTHYHFIISSNGADISKFMKSINQSYSQYYNKKYERHGHVFSDRFKSLPVTTDKYLLTLSSYIHNNANDLKGYKNKIEKYKYSSFIYYSHDNMKCPVTLVKEPILNYYGNNISKSISRYMDFVKKFSPDIICTQDEIIKDPFELTKEMPEYVPDKHVLLRDINPQDVISFISKNYFDKSQINVKFLHKNSSFRALCVVCMRSLCDCSLKNIGKILGNITSSNVWKLSESGFSLITSDTHYNNVIENLINNYKAA